MVVGPSRYDVVMSSLDVDDAAVLLAALEVLPGTPQDLSELLEIVGGASKLLHEMDGVSHRESELLHFLRSAMDASRVAFWKRSLQELRERRPDVSMIPVTDSRYPSYLKDCHDRPPFLFTTGTVPLSTRSTVSIVGSRRASQAALDTAAAMAELSVKRGITVVSGLARGVDRAAHEGALGAGGTTFAVLGSGIDSGIYPPENVELATSIRERGAIVSQFRPNAPPTKTSFVIRNSTISGLSPVSFVVQADEKSGTSSEVDAALRQGHKVVFWAPLMKSVPWADWLSRLDNVVMVDDLEFVLNNELGG